MKIGIISDIHAHIEPLDRALLILDSLQVDIIVCAGDLVDVGKDGDGVVDLIRRRDIVSVRGNHDEDAFSDQAWLRRSLKASGEQTSSLLLKSETVAYVTSLPLHEDFDWEGYKVCLAHGTPNSNRTYLFPNSSQEKYTNAIEKTDADIILLGHTHEPMDVHVNGRRFFNPGSTFRNRSDDSQTCGVLHLPELKFNVINIRNGQPYCLRQRNISLP